MQKIFYHVYEGRSREDVLHIAPLESVCRSWRDVLLSMQHLYTDIYINTSLLVRKTFVERCIARSGSLPLTVHYENYDSRACDDVFSVCAAHSWRWRQLHFCSSYRPLECETIRGNLDTLETLSLHIHSLDRAVDSFQIAPRLRTVQLIGAAAYRHLAMPWSQLTSLSVEFCDTVTCFELLKLCPDLEYFAYSTLWHVAGPDLRHRSDRMHSLQLQVLHGDADILQHLTLPQLRTLVVDADVTTEWIEESLLDFVHRSRCPLKKLVLDVGDRVVDKRDLINVLDSLPDLVHLSARCCAMFDDDIRTLYPKTEISYR